LTGGIGSGKSLAGEYLANLGATVVDADQLARSVVERGEPAFNEILTRFGDVVLKDGALDRSKLAEIIFADPAAKAEVEAITHPRIREALDQIATSAGHDEIVIYQIPLLVESKGAERFDRVIAVSAPVSLRKERAIARGMAGYDFDKRLSHQATDLEREAIADYIIDNSGDREALLAQVEQLWESELKPAVAKS
jgi:dephospho-CoA kinase